MAGTVAAVFHGGEQSSTGAEEQRSGGDALRQAALRGTSQGAEAEAAGRDLEQETISAFPVKTKGQSNIIARWS